MIRRIVAVFLLVNFISVSVFADRGNVEYVPARAYFATVQREIERAKTSISAYLYLFSLQPNESHSDVFRLAQSLKKAHDAGVNVEVVLDQNIDFAGEEGASVEAKNLAAYVFLKKSGIPVYFDDATTYTHAKALIIDEETVIVGSSNWSRAAFEVNEETNVLIRSKAVAREMLTALRAIPREEPVTSGPSVPVPVGFLLDKALFGQMLTRSDERAFDIYLFLLWEMAGKIVLDYEKLAAHLGIDGMGREAYRRQINKALGKLEERYRLISVSKRFGQSAEITLLPLPNGESVSMPVAYWDLGWTRRLSFAGKAFYLMSLRESANSPLQPRWSVQPGNPWGTLRCVPVVHQPGRHIPAQEQPSGSGIRRGGSDGAGRPGPQHLYAQPSLRSQ